MSQGGQRTQSRGADQPPVISVRGLCAHWGARRVLHDVELVVQPREVVVIMGGSGSGKSTLLRHLLGLKRPTSGEVEVLGVDLCRARPGELHALRSNMGVAFQGGALFSSLTVLENVVMPLEEHTRLDRHTMNIMARLKLEVVNLAGSEDLMPSQLSGGMVKRAALARAVVMDPQLLFFDEPSAGLDPVVAAEIDDLILELREAMHMSIVVVTHELDSAFKIADRLVVLDQGTVVTQGTVEEVRSSDNERVQALLNRRASAPVFDPDAYLARLTAT
jgi:phospholipid/cholesterol/gamma-HCH transport system ATP-binding protein